MQITAEMWGLISGWKNKKPREPTMTEPSVPSDDIIGPIRFSYIVTSLKSNELALPFL